MKKSEKILLVLLTCVVSLYVFFQGFGVSTGGPGANNPHKFLTQLVTFGLKDEMRLYRGLSSQGKEAFIMELISGEGEDDASIFLIKAHRVEIDADSRIGGVDDYLNINNVGDCNFVEGAGLQTGAMSFNDDEFSVNLIAEEFDYQVVGFNVNGFSNGDVFPDHTQDHILTQNEGAFLISYHVSVNAPMSNTYQFRVKYNNGTVDLPDFHTENTIPVAGKTTGSGVSYSAILPKGATVELWVRRLDGAAVPKTLTFSKANLMITQIAGSP